MGGRTGLQNKQRGGAVGNMVRERELDYKQRGGAGGNMVWEGELDYRTSREEEQEGI